MSLAALTNHSHGEVVYRKLSAAEPNPAAPSCEPLPAAFSPGEAMSAGLAVVKVQKQGRRLIAILAGGQRDGLLPGTILQTSRQGIPTALLKATEVREKYSLAEVTTDGSKDSGLHFPEAPGLMVGDRAEPQELKISQSLRILPHRTLTYDRLFIDPKNFPSTFELSDKGRRLLIEQARILMNAHAPLLLVEGHTDPKGDRQSNQVESYQRAMTVRQVLLDEFGLDPNRVVAIGLGETEPLDEPYLPGRAEEARRIILKVKSQPLPH
jgi:outer membrane protein OmpA-like peptidoglycan-associated protein